MSAMTERMDNESKHFLDDAQHLLDHLGATLQTMISIETTMETICKSAVSAIDAANKELSGGGK